MFVEGFGADPNENEDVAGAGAGADMFVDVEALVDAPKVKDGFEGV